MIETKNKLVLIDGHALAYRMYYALPVEAFSTGEGEITNATYGFMRQLLDILLDNPPRYLAVTFDAGMSGRTDLYPDYKGTREKSPEDLAPQVERIKEILAALNVPVLVVEGWEADDLIGTAAVQAEAQGVGVHVVTGDKDLLQLVTEHTTVQLPGRRQGEVKVYGPARFRTEYELEPAQLPDLKGFMGDKSDNIPGVRGIGIKGATKLLKAYGSVEGVYEHLDDMKGAQLKRLSTGRDDAFLSKELATIQRDAPITLDLAACAITGYDPAPVLSLFRALEFHTFANRITRAGQDEPAAVPRATQAVGRQMSMFGDAEADMTKAPPAPAEPPTATNIVDDTDKLSALVRRLESAEAITIDTETTGTDQMQVKLVGIAITDTSEEGFYIPVGHKTGEQQLALEQVIEALQPILSNPDIPKYGHNIKYDAVVLRRHGLDVRPLSYDTMIAAWVSNPGARIGLKQQAWQRLDIEMTGIKTLIGKGKSQKTMAEVPVADAAPYAAADADITHRLVANITPELHEKQLWDLFNLMEMPLVPVLVDMEMHGVTLDAPYLKKMSGELGEKLHKLEGEIHALAGFPFNINSPKQLSETLFDRMGLPREGLRKTASGHISTAAGVLELLLDEDGNKPEIISLILTYRELAKLKGTYVDALPQLINPGTGRVHTSFNQAGTSTGRFSSSDPNLQNIPIRTPTGARVRHAFVAPVGHVFLACDYSQVELRVLAHICQDPGLLKAFREGQDIHAATAAMVFSIPIDTITKTQRSFAKRVNFGLLYGMGTRRLAQETDLTYAEAEAFVKAYFDGFPNVRQYLEDTKQKAAEQGYLETLFGRRRYFPTLDKDKRVSHQVRRAAEREAINMPIQGTAADILKIAVVRLHTALRARGLRGRMILQVHDELVLEVPEDELEETAALVKDVMRGAGKLDAAAPLLAAVHDGRYDLDAPLLVDANAGPNWGELEAL